MSARSLTMKRGFSRRRARMRPGMRLAGALGGRRGQLHGNGLGNLEQLSAADAFIAILQKLNPGFRHHFGERKLRRLEQGRVDYGIQRGEDKVHIPLVLLAVHGEQVLQKVRVQAPGLEVRVRQNPLVQGNRSLDSLHHKHLQRPAHARNGLRPVPAVNHQFGDQRIVVRRNHRVGVGRPCPRARPALPGSRTR